MEQYKERIEEIDFLKAVMIILMVMFHLVWFSSGHPYAKLVVYTFHMPAFLLISGFFLHSDRSPRQMLSRELQLLIPYLIMEAGYIFMCRQLPVNEHIEALTLSVWVYRLFIHPLGPYWYLQTLLLCQIVYYVIFHFNLGRTVIANIILMALAMYMLRNLVVFSNAMYVMIGIVLHENRQPFLRVFRSSWLVLLPLVWLLCFPANLDRSTLPGLAITYLVICLCLTVYPWVARLVHVRTLLLAVGRNTLPILVFSPIFTLMAKPLVPLFSFDPTRLCFMVLAVAVNLIGCYLVTWMMDRLHLSRWFFWKQPEWNK